MQDRKMRDRIDQRPNDTMDQISRVGKCRNGKCGTNFTACIESRKNAEICYVVVLHFILCCSVFDYSVTVVTAFNWRIINWSFSSIRQCYSVTAEHNKLKGEITAWKNVNPDSYMMHKYSRYSSKQLQQWFSLIMHDTVEFHVPLKAAKTHNSNNIHVHSSDMLWPRTGVCYTTCVNVELIICISGPAFSSPAFLFPHFPVLYFPPLRFLFQPCIFQYCILVPQTWHQWSPIFSAPVCSCPVLRPRLQFPRRPSPRETPPKVGIRGSS